MQKEVVVYECDNCGATGIPDEDADKHIKHPLPKWWAEVGASTDGGRIFDLQLCGNCMTAIGNALGSRRT